MRERPVNARAVRAAIIVASVPVTTKRMTSMLGISREIVCASSTSSGVAIARLVPWPIASRTASTTTSGEWPSGFGPKPMIRST